MGKSLKSLSATYLFNMFDKTVNLSATTVKLTKEGKVLTVDDMKLYLAEFERRYAFPLKNKTLLDFKEGRVLLVYNDKNYRLPATVPAFLVNTGQQIVCCVNISNDTRINKNGEYMIDTKLLYSLMQMGTIVALCYSKFSYMKNKVGIIKFGSRMYAKLFQKVMNKMFTLSISPAKSDTITFVASMFFITNMLGRDEESVEEMNKKYSLDNCSKVNQLVIDDYGSGFTLADYKNFDTFIEAIRRNIPGMEDLTVRGFIDNYMTQYGPTMLLGLEYLPFFFGNLGYVTVGAMINKQSTIENVLGKDITDLMTELNNI